MFSFKIIAKDEEARAGKLVTPHGSINTPSYVAVGTQGTVKAVSADGLRAIGTQVVIANTFHLHPGEEFDRKDRWAPPGHHQ